MNARATVPASRGALALALGTLYVVWGSTYLGIAVAVRTLPPLLMAGARFLCAGAILYVVLRLAGTPGPRREHLRGALVAGTLLLLLGNGIVCLVAHAVPSGVIALVIGSTPLFAVLLQWALGGARPRDLTLAGIALGMVGVAAIAVVRGAGAGAQAWSIVALLLAVASWALGTLLTPRCAQPASPMMATATQMLCGGALLTVAALARGEAGAIAWSTVSLESAVAFGYLVLIGSIAGFGAFVWLTRHATPAVTTSYAFVNPLVALLLGAWLNGERVTAPVLVAAALIVTAVVLVLRGRR